MYNKKIFVVIVIFIFIIVAMILMLHRNQKISSKIRTVYNKTEQTTFEVRLSDFTDFESPSRFIIYPFEDSNSDIKAKNFLEDDAVFRGEKIYYNGENRYVLKPY